MYYGKGRVAAAVVPCLDLSKTFYTVLHVSLRSVLEFPDIEDVILSGSEIDC